MTTYLLAGGGTAGHVNPLLAVAERIRLREPDSEVLILGTKEGLEARLVPARGFELLTIAKLPFPRRPNRAALKFPARLRATIDEVVSIIAERGVDVVVGFGGYVAAPAYLGARKAGVPLVIHEANSRPGIANRLGSFFTKFVGTAFDRTPIRGGVVVGMPLRAEIENLDRFAARTEADAFFGLDPKKPTLLVTGGSSGAKRINDTISASITRILGAGWQVLHITGEYRDAVDDQQLPGYIVVKYCDRMELALAAADLAIARAGTSTVAELTGLGVPAIYVPYPVGNGEQKYNARTAVEAGAAVLVTDSRFVPQWVSSELVPMLRKRALIADMAARASSVGSLDGTDRMLELVDLALGRDLPLTS
ncbi:UDP-N-acetylglucosamine--N-acetylmuramyl-(pentapeptide) pyrophosphoryl-undecaprenol N-acetylglucosamine transferase [Salinibacterium sp. NSLL150]|uniref:UDP-N-acetylglucosamine--N-acetylmuramyl- (pentapeptide) pyrophosphoryl-undecaprenol N-acetylglucosamine transferase n=1 Tax=unclassified Salinibacterium TaxID=2632331 RepID=UPI0018CD8289|nr:MULTISPECIES: UDP-N-acetylglucosamine--N-acetylmuramyl-(pentapeptide) pyrophosphoryl-undecaprenol N-acetylglucosamine transferase [unclassified Salinibacterium]MBH0099253.1 UDP-N-acetylglucosamine--N-acetylmuramyl-(pentapeptide) pyrophosphoryl-undecaprenol N-acetylglucosamine transferase [Salinibacterium sp. NSLL35]MBH0102007.1 UDP-N-acetylglucosamine--N-acetylmuramyl-(pentapeptide) pyrophosphoryl-undecaprenol N-acetylglucosamine transferase [Salinibacterium sp. NSLL150]MBH0104767.1 UDP-N-ace